MQFIVSRIGGGSPHMGPVDGPPAYSPEWVAAAYGRRSTRATCPTVTIGFPIDPPWTVDPLNVPCDCGALGYVGSHGAIVTEHTAICRYVTWQEAEARTADRPAWDADVHGSDASRQGPLTYTVGVANRHSLREGPA